MDGEQERERDPRFSESGEGSELRKPHEMVVMVPRSKRVTLTGRRIYNVLLYIAQTRLATLESMPPADYMFEAPLAAILRTTGSSGEERTAAKRYLREMRGLEVDWESTAPGDGVKWRGFSMLSEVAIEVRNGDNWVSWSYPPTIMAALRDPARWSRLHLGVLARLSTYSGIALYDICARYRDNPSGLTSRKPVQWWIDALSQMPAGSERREWRKFKNERLKEAIEEINRDTDLEIELIEHKQGRAVAEAQFAVRRKHRTSSMRFEVQDAVDANLVLRAESLGIREMKLEKLIQEFGEARVREKLTAVERRMANSRLRGVENAYSYLRSLLRNDSDEPAPQDSGVAGPPRLAAPPVPGPTGATAEDAWLAQRHAQLRDEIGRLDAEHRKLWVDRALHELASQKLLSAIIARRAAQGDVLHGLLGSYVVRIYARETYGPDWDRPPRLTRA